MVVRFCMELKKYFGAKMNTTNSCVLGFMSCVLSFNISPSENGICRPFDAAQF